jgi:hypothetical protein
MSTRPTTASPHPESRVDPGLILIALGAVMLFVSLFMHWYRPGLTAWTVFEVWDLVLAVLALVALTAVAARLGMGPRRSSSWLTVPAVLATVIVVASLVNHPPAAADRNSLGVHHDPMIGLWLALAASILMLAGVAMSVARVSVAVRIHGEAGGPGAAPPGPPPSAAPPTSTQATSVMPERPAPPAPPGAPQL